MQGLFYDAPLIGVMELLHVSRQTGLLVADAEIPFNVSFVQGEVVDGGILDWLGLDAIYASPLLPEQGSFSFSVQEMQGVPLAAYDKITADWARYSDEWSQLCQVIGSPSAVFTGDLPLFDTPEGKSVRVVARSTHMPLFEVAERVAEGVENGKLTRLDTYAWFALRLKHQVGSGRGGRVAAALDGERTLGELVAQGYSAAELRAYMLDEIKFGLRFPGTGWVLRDLLWERQFQEQNK
ncbi:DUF4388 domain-containing protein [Deinococcus sonorensis]|uniref:DUF4388 domain-containing protein n=2 Tax=Deinococcus sonorensis TaxID=309891 RepID=A0AAU7U8I9_9DEIO